MQKMDVKPNSLPVIDLSAVTYNSAQWIDRFIESLLNQDYPPSKINLSIHDNGSTDDTVARCRSAMERCAGRLHGVTISGGENLGFGYGHNQNLNRSTAEYFMVTNVDLEFATDSISEVISIAEQDDATVASWEFRQKPYEHPKYYDPVSLETNWSSSACILFRRSALAEVGGYEERIFMYGEDVELSYRLRDRGYKLKYCPRAVCWHYTYAHANQLKPIQFFGSTLANFYIRMRYGSVREIFFGLVMYLGLWLYSPALPGKWRGLFLNGMRMVHNAPYFLGTRKRSNNVFPFRSWDYEFRREGAFYQYRRNEGNEQPLVSVVMRTYKGRLCWLREAVASVVNQTYPNIELVIVEDGTEEARDFVNELTGQSRLASIVYLPIPKKGRCHAGNAGLQAASGKFLAFLDDDDLFFADHIEVLISELQNEPSLAAAYGLAFQVQTSVQSHTPFVYVERRYDVMHRQKFSRPILWHHNYIPIQAIVFRRELYDEYGGFDESLDNLEDWNLWTRYSIKRDFLLVEKVTSLYRVPAERKKLMERQRMLDIYYAQATEKQRELKLELSPRDVMAYAEELSQNINVVVISNSRIRKILMKNRFLNIFYVNAVKIANQLRRRRTQ